VGDCKTWNGKNTLKLMFFFWTNLIRHSSLFLLNRDKNLAPFIFTIVFSTGRFWKLNLICTRRSRSMSSPYRSRPSIFKNMFSPFVQLRSLNGSWWNNVFARFNLLFLDPFVASLWIFVVVYSCSLLFEFQSSVWIWRKQHHESHATCSYRFCVWVLFFLLFFVDRCQNLCW
jgi:hypothetical protein